MESGIEIVEFTDPYCTWCWGSEPVLRHALEAYGDQLSLRFVMGGLVEDRATFYDPANGIGGEQWERQIAAHWVEASRRHGMPVDMAHYERVLGMPSTYPANIAYEAAKLQDSKLADRYLRRLREAAAIEGLAIHELEVLADLAAEIGPRPRAFRARLLGLGGGRLRGRQRDLRHLRRAWLPGLPGPGRRAREGPLRLPGASSSSRGSSTCSPAAQCLGVIRRSTMKASSAS